jgi:undecaprenyl-diphosphatase
MHYLQILLLALVQGFAELLPVSSSAHVIVAEKLMGLDPTTPEMTLLLVMLHTGTMFAVIFYFWKNWRSRYFQSSADTMAFLKQVFLATLATVVLGSALKFLIEKVVLKATPNAEVEMIFGNLTLISLSLGAAGCLILFSSRFAESARGKKGLGPGESLWIGLVQGLCLPFRGFSRSGATISTGLILGLAKAKAEDFSFALAVVLTPAVDYREIHRLMKAHAFSGLSMGEKIGLFSPGFLGMAFSFLAGLLALKWLSSWLEEGRWAWFGVYCLAAAVAVWLLA